jgi:small subunit ribosomal protein S9
MAKDTYYYALGRRKSATARVRLQAGKGAVVVNGKPAADYFANSELFLNEIISPLVLIEKEKNYDVSVVVDGGGHAGQVDAIKRGIAKAIATMNEDLRSTLKRADMLGRDPRKKERKKFGLKKARKQRQFTKR